MQVVVRQLSGLGNQLFQYSAGVYFARLYGADLRLIVDRPEESHSYGYPRPFLLSHFNIPHAMHPPEIVDRLVMPKTDALLQVSRLFKLFFGVQVIAEALDQRYTFVKDLPRRAPLRRLYLFGYWQAHQYSGAVEAELRKDLQFKDPPTGKNREVLQRISGCTNPVSLHIRRGDYRLAAEGNISLPFDYYEQAIALTKKRLPNPVFFVFSDDIAYARERMPADIEAVFVDHNNDFTAHEDIRLMSACHDHIIANSSFSWWGAWLNPRSDKNVIAPKYWKLKSDSYFPDLLPSSWTIL